MKSRVAILISLVVFSLTASAMPHASWSQIRGQSDPNCTQAGGDNGLGELIQQVNLFRRLNPANGTYDPRGTLKEMAPVLKISQHESHLREVVGDIFCPGISYATQGTATLISEDGSLLTNAHILLGDKGKDMDALSTCFWQRKGSSERLALDPRSFKPLTRDTHSEFYKDLAIVRLKRPLRGVRPVKIDTSGEELKEGDQYLMVSATQEEVASAQYSTEKIATPGGTQSFTYSRDLIVQSCATIVISQGLWGDCSALEKASGSGVFIVRGDEILLKGIHKAGGKRLADGSAFNLDNDAPKGRSYSYEVQLNRDIASELESLIATNDKGRTSLGEQRASLDPK